MAKSSGLGDRLLVGGNDVSGDIGSLSRIGGSKAALEFTGIDKKAFERKGGLRDGAIEFTSYFNPDGAHPVLAALPTADVVVSYFRGTAQGNTAASIVAKQVGYDPTRGNDGALTLNTSAQANGFGLEWGVMLTAGPQTDTSATNSGGLDQAALGTGYIAFSGASGDYVSTPDAADLDITGDIDIRCKVALDDWVPATHHTLIGKWDSAGDENSYQLAVNTTGKLSFGWSADGTTANASSAQSSVVTGFTDGTAHWVRAVLDADDGASDASVTFYTSEDGVTWTQLGDVQAVGSTTSIHSGSAALVLGAQGLGLANRIAGRFYEAEVYDGSTLVAHPVAGADGVTDAEGLTWTVNGNAYTSTETRHGAQAYLHVLSFTGTSCTVKIQDSPDDSTYNDLVSFSAATGATSERKTATGTVERYVRVATTGTFSECTFAVMFKRNLHEVVF